MTGDTDWGPALCGAQPRRPRLVEHGEFTSHSGLRLSFKVECDALTDADLADLAKVISSKITFGAVYGVPRGGTRLAKALLDYCTFCGEDPLLIVDDVLTTGASMEEARAANPIFADAIGVVLFARGPCPEWVRPVFTVNEWAQG